MLVRAAVRAIDGAVRLAALGRLDNAADLLTVAVRTGKPDVGLRAVERLGDEDDRLIQAVREAQLAEMKVAAAARLSDLGPVVEDLVAAARDPEADPWARVGAALGHVADSDCLSCSRCGQSPCHVFGEGFREPGGPPDAVACRCAACGAIRRRWSETCDVCDGTGATGEELVDHGTNSGASWDPIPCGKCEGFGRVDHQTLTRRKEGATS